MRHSVHIYQHVRPNWVVNIWLAAIVLSLHLILVDRGFPILRYLFTVSRFPCRNLLLYPMPVFRIVAIVLPSVTEYHWKGSTLSATWLDKWSGYRSFNNKSHIIMAYHSKFPKSAHKPTKTFRFCRWHASFSFMCNYYNGSNKAQETKYSLFLIPFLESLYVCPSGASGSLSHGQGCNPLLTWNTKTWIQK